MTITPTDITARIPAARAALAGVAYRTPLEGWAWLAGLAGADALLKLESYQPIGSFKLRGALAALTHLAADERECGVVTASAGNHGLGVAYAAHRLGIPATVVVAEDASPAKVAAMRRYPIDLLVQGADYDAAEAAGRRLAAERGLTFVSPYNDPWVIAGAGTIGAEILEDRPEVGCIVVPAGGGGLLAGIACWVKQVRPQTRVIGVQSEASPSMVRALEAGEIVPIPVLPSIADGISGNIEEGSITVPLIQATVDDIVLVSEAEIEEAIRATVDEMHLIVEGSGAAAIAALMQQRVPGMAGQTVAAVVTGRNIATERLLRVMGQR